MFWRAEREKQTKRAPLCLFILQMPGPGWDQEPRSWSRSPKWMAQPRVLSHRLLSPIVCICRKLELGMEFRHSEMDVGILTIRPNTCPFGAFLKLVICLIWIHYWTQPFYTYSSVNWCLFSPRYPHFPNVVSGNIQIGVFFSRCWSQILVLGVRAVE